MRLLCFEFADSVEELSSECGAVVARVKLYGAQAAFQLGETVGSGLLGAVKLQLPDVGLQGGDSGLAGVQLGLQSGDGLLQRGDLALPLLARLLLGGELGPDVGDRLLSVHVGDGAEMAGQRLLRGEQLRLPLVVGSQQLVGELVLRAGQAFVDRAARQLLRLACRRFNSRAQLVDVGAQLIEAGG